jgi:hypothetical protein
MHLAPTQQLHVITAGQKKAVVEYVESEKYQKYRCVTWYDGHVIMPYYYTTEVEALERARRFTKDAS